MKKVLLASCVTAALFARTGHADAANLLFWSEYNSGSIGRVDTDGTNATNILINVVTFGAAGVAVDPVGQKVYWANYAGGGSGANIQRANLDGTSVENVVTSGGNGIWDVDVDSVNSKVYWTTWPSSGVYVRSSNYDGSSMVTVTSTTVYGAGMAVDPGAGKVYWSKSGSNVIVQANLDGTGAVDYIAATTPGYMDIDLVNHYLYYGSVGREAATSIYRKNLTDASAPVLIASGLSGVADMEVDPDGTLYFVKNTATKGIYKIDLTGSFPATPTLVYNLASQSLPVGLGFLSVPVPEPASVGLLTLGCVMLTRRGKHAR